MKPRYRWLCLCRTHNGRTAERRLMSLCLYTVKVHLVSLRPWLMTFDLENLFSNSHSYDEYLCQVSLRFRHQVQRSGVTRHRCWLTDSGQTTVRGNCCVSCHYEQRVQLLLRIHNNLPLYLFCSMKFTAAVILLRLSTVFSSNYAKCKCCTFTVLHVMLLLLFFFYHLV